MGLLDIWRHTFVVGRVFAVAVVIEVIVLFAFEIASLSVPIVYQDSAEVAVIVLFLVTLAFFVFYAIDGVMGKNLFEVLCFQLSSLLLLAYAINEFVKESANPDTSAYNRAIGMLSVHSICCVLYLVLLVPIYREIGWSIFKNIGSKQAMRSMYKVAQLFLTFLRLDVQFTFMMIMAGGVFLFRSDDYELYVDIFAAILTLVWALAGWYMGIKKESKSMMYVFFVYCPAEPVYVIYKLVQIYTNAVKYFLVPRTLFTLLVVFAVFVRLVLTTAGVLALLNFGKGLKEEVFLRSNERV